jgi:hypothetical protein
LRCNTAVCIPHQELLKGIIEGAPAPTAECLAKNSTSAVRFDADMRLALPPKAAPVPPPVGPPAAAAKAAAAPATVASVKVRCFTDTGL